MTEGRTVPGDMTLDQAVPTKSNYLSKEDCDPPILVQIAHMSWDTIEGDYGEEQKTVLHFHGDTKPFVLNQTNKELLKAATGATTVNEIKDKHIVLFNDPTIMFRGKVTGGIRIRAPKPGFQQPTTAARAPAPEPQMPDARDYDDGIPF